MTTKLFNAKQFTATKWNSQEDKAKFANHFVDFVKSGFSQSKFHKWFYNRLHMTFGMIAHYDQGGFFATYFEDDQGKVDFIQECLRYHCWGDVTYTYSDVEKALQVWLRENSILEKLQQERNRMVEYNERRLLAGLKRKYEG